MKLAITKVMKLMTKTQKRGRPWVYHCEKIVCIRSFSGPYFHAFGLNTERYRESLHIQSECGKIRTRNILNTYNFYDVHCPLIINSFMANIFISYPLKAVENARFSGVFSRFKMRTLTRYGLVKITILSTNIVSCFVYSVLWRS